VCDSGEPMMRFRGDIGEWGNHAEAIGTRFLKGDAASRDDAQGIMLALGVTKCRPFEFHCDVGIDECSRKALMQYVICGGGYMCVRARH
jgi:hypothetical protein